MNDNEAYSEAWQKLAGTINQNKVNSFFDESLIEMQRFYNEIGHPNGAREEDFWEWLKEELFSARKRSLNKKEKVILALEESLKKRI